MIAADSDRRSPGFRSRHVRGRLRYPDPAVDPTGTAAAILGAVVARRIDLVVPVTDDVIVALGPVRGELERVTRLALPPDDQLEIASDKDRTRRLAEMLGVPVPRSVVVAERGEADAAASDLGWPVVVKPLRSRTVADGAGIVAHAVRYAGDSAELRGLVARLGTPLLLQEYWPGEGIGVELLLRDGKPLAVFQHRRLREVPPGGGASSFRESVAPDPVLVAHATRLMSEMRWTGLAMVEFRVGARGPVLLEVNGRIWGSLPLAVKAGVDFPAGLAALHLPPDTVPRGDAVASGSYRSGVRSRNLPLEVAWIGSVIAGRSAAPGPLPPRREALAVALRLAWPGDGYDVLSLDDPAPGLAEIANIVRSIPERVARSIRGETAPARTRAGETGIVPAEGAGHRRSGRRRLPRPGLQSVARDTVARAGHAPGAVSLARMLSAAAGDAGRTLAVVTYHRIDDPDRDPTLEPALVSATPSEFRAQVEELARTHRPISAEELLAAHRTGRRLPSRALLITLDDATADVADVAWPVLRAAGVPAVVFVPTGFPGALAPFWWDRLRASLTALAPRDVDTPLGAVHLDGASSIDAAAARLRRWVKSVPHATAMRWIEHLWDEADCPSVTANALDWPTLERLAGEGLSLAAHTHTHPLLTRVDADQAVSEVRRSRDELRRRAPGSHDVLFAYPSGAWSEDAAAAVERAGIELAFTTDRGVNRAGTSPALALRRINVGRRSSPALIAAQVAVGRGLARSGRDRAPVAGGTL